MRETQEISGKTGESSMKIQSFERESERIKEHEGLGRNLPKLCISKRREDSSDCSAIRSGTGGGCRHCGPLLRAKACQLSGRTVQSAKALIWAISDADRFRKRGIGTHDFMICEERECGFAMGGKKQEGTSGFGQARILQKWIRPNMSAGMLTTQKSIRQ